MKNNIARDSDLPSMQIKDFVTFHIERVTKEDTRKGSRVKFQPMSKRSRDKTQTCKDSKVIK